MAQRRPQHTRNHPTLPISPSPSASSATGRRKYPARRLPNSRRRALGVLHTSHSSSSHAHLEARSDESDEDDTAVEDSSGRLRPVLAALHQNLRRLPSRLLLAASNKRDTSLRNRDISMRDLQREQEVVQVGAKRKRVVSSNENVVSQSKRGSGRKRMKATRQPEESEEGENISEMEVDTPFVSAQSDESDPEEEDSCQLSYSCSTRN